MLEQASGVYFALSPSVVQKFQEFTNMTPPNQPGSKHRRDGPLYHASHQHPKENLQKLTMISTSYITK